MRNSIERPEALDAGSMMLSGLDSATVLAAIEIVTKEQQQSSVKEIPQEYLIKNTSLRVIKLIAGTVKQANKWRNLEEFSRYDWS